MHVRKLRIMMFRKEREKGIKEGGVEKNWRTSFPVMGQHRL